ncbi:unnamed protein product, partial [Mesorhabditis belari]|uniref:SAM domain-containing protein n=1 Tax=Mesorhabditis belari TaxID=2138241 RepID=A0AAF3F3A3_9BILA
MTYRTETASDVLRWTTDDVRRWLLNKGFEKYSRLIADEHQIDGKILLLLTEDDLREKPLQITCLGDIKRLGLEIAQLRSRYNSGNIDSKKSEDVLLCVDYESTKEIEVAGKSVPIKTIETAVITDESLADTLATVGDVHGIHLISREELIRSVESPDTAFKSFAKLVIAFLYCSVALLFTSFVMVVVHDRVPDMKMYPPLPDIVLDNLPLIPWAFEMCEVIGMILSTVWFTVLFFHKHRIVVARRMFSMVGSVFLLRCITMLITSLSVPGVHLECRAKGHGSIWEKVWEAYHIWSRLGMSIQGVRTCGDYMFSGHTTAITLLNHFITEYTPSSWVLLHTLTWVLNLFGIFFILAGHEHYSIDVFIAFYISSRMFLYYHAYAYNHANLTATDNRMRLWFPLGWFFEAGSKGKLNNEYAFPISFTFGRRSKVTANEPANGTLKKEHSKENGIQKNDTKINSRPSQENLEKLSNGTNGTNGTARHRKKKN